MADLVLRPWFDRVALHAIVHWYFPLSRAWAAAIEAGDDLDAFLAAVGRVRLPLLQVERILGFTAQKQRAYEEAASAWEEAFFGPGEVAPATLREIEDGRLLRANASMAARSAFMPLHLSRRLPAVRWQVAPERDLERRHVARLQDVAFPAAARVEPEASRAMPGAAEHVHWLRFPTTIDGEPDTAWARVATPLATKDPPTLIFLHGIAMETEFWRGDARAMLRGLTEAGVRLVQPEGPWHGRRRAPGWYGGEPAMGLGPLGMISLFESWIAEVANLIAWARATSRGAVAVGGVSLGALTSQLLAVAASGWPAALRPDAFFLVATSGAVIDVAAQGRMAAELQAGARLAAAGWSPERLQRWRRLFEPLGAPCVDPARIVMVLGTEDVVTPFKGGAQLAKEWKVPRRNAFVRPQGHFSVALGLSRRTDPLRRLVEILR